MDFKEFVPLLEYFKLPQSNKTFMTQKKKEDKIKYVEFTAATIIRLEINEINEIQI